MKIYNFNNEPLMPWEVEIICNTSLSHNYVADAIGRSYASIKYHRKKLGIIVEKEAKQINNYTPEEISIIKENVGKTDEQLAQLLGRTTLAVSLKRQKIGLQSSRDYWSKEDVEFLTASYKKLSVRNIATQIGRTESAIQSMAYQLGLTKKCSFWRKPEIAILQDNIHRTPTELLALLPNKTLEQISYKKSHLNFFNKQKVNPAHTSIEKDVRISKHSVTLRYLEILNTMEVGESLQYPEIDKTRVNSATRELAQKRFVTKSDEQDLRRIWRIE